MSITATELKLNLGKYLLLAEKEDVFITKNGYGDMVIMSLETFEKNSGMSDFYSDVKFSRGKYSDQQEK